MTKKLMVMAGGTGGHVFPGLAVAEHLQQQGWQIDWLGTSDRMESRLVPEHGFPIHFIDIAGVRGNGLLRLLKAPFMIIHAIWQAISVFRKTRPNVVLGMGGYASGPGGIAAWLMGIPLILHEQNAAAGMTNKMLAPLARKVLTGFSVPDWQGKGAKVRQVGNPVRSTFSRVSEKQSVNSPLNVLICGGSLGAQALNQQVPKTVAELSDLNLNIWHQTGKGHRASVFAAYDARGVDTNRLRIDEFIKDMNQAYEWADVVICRAGALTVAEVALAGRCAIFVPLPHAVDDHQTLNARFLESQSAAIILPQPRLANGELTTILRNLVKETDEIIKMSVNARNAGTRDATNKVADICIEEASCRV